MARYCVYVILPLVLLIAVTFASEGESGPRRNRVAGQTEHDAPLRTAPVLTSSVTNATTKTDSLFEDVDSEEHPLEPIGEEKPKAEEGDVEKNDKKEMAEEDEEDEGEEYEGEGEEEYEDELKTIAESHEAMSKDDTRNSNISIGSSIIPERTPLAKSFDSHEVVVNNSDEDVASNEAITDEVIDKNDGVVAELLKYKTEKIANMYRGDKTKMKRVPTVKKELSTQREILAESNETEVAKSRTPSEDTLNQLNERNDTASRRGVLINEASKGKGQEGENPGRASGEGEIAIDNQYSGLESGPENPKKLDKRRETVLKDLKSYLLKEYTTEEEQREKLREVGAQEDALAENLLKLLVKLAEDPNRWERLHKLLTNMENELKVSSNTLEPSKRGYETTSTFLTTTSPSEDSRKSRKKFKKKKKKPKHRKLSTITTTTVTSAPVSPTLLTTTETPWQTTPVQWRLVAERLFGPPWQQDLQEETEKGGKVRYYSGSKARPLPSFRDLIDQYKSKDTVKSFNTDRKSIISEAAPREIGGQSRLLRYGKINTHQPSNLQGHREFTNVYDRPAEPDHIPDYDVPETYQRLRYNQLPPGSRDFLHRRQDDDYQDDYNLQTDNFAHNQEYHPPGRQFAMSKSWPDISYKYARPWKMEDRSMLPISSSKWPWRQTQTDLKYWPQRGKLLQPERNYWTSLSNEEEIEDESEPEKTWQQQRLPKHSWDRERSNTWPIEKPMKISPSWQQPERPMKIYDRDQSNSSWEKSKNRSELSKTSIKGDSKDKTVLPQITMKTWNSLTSDPATWPYKLPGAKPWPKDENGKSYNPNADLVKKLGLDKQNNPADWPKEDNEKPYDPNVSRKLRIEKQGRSLSSNESSREEDDSSKYRSSKNNFSDYKTRGETKDSVKSPSWSMTLPATKNTKDWSKPDNLQNDDSNAWNRKYDPTKNSWVNKDSLPKIQSVGAWVMPADQSTWKPYQIKPIEAVDDNSSTSRLWSSGRSSPDENKWSNKDTNVPRTWTERVKPGSSWIEDPNDRGWTDKSRLPSSWPGKAIKSNAWFAKSKEVDTWKSDDSDSWRTKIKGDSTWSRKPNESSWPSKMLDNNSWTTKMNNGRSWLTQPNKSGVPWRTDGNADISKYNNREPWSKMKNDDSWKNNEANSWSRKSNDQNSWSPKNGDIGSWQQKINDDWSYKNSGSTSSWPSKWKQFAYHRVTAMPISKPGTTADASASKSKNAFVAVSAVSSPKYGGNDWHKNEEETHNENSRLDDQDRSSNQLQVGLERPIYTWKKDASNFSGNSLKKGNGTDLLENQLEALRQIDFWRYKGNELEKEPSFSTTERTMSRTNLTTTSVESQKELTSKDNGNLVETHRQAIPMK